MLSQIELSDEQMAYAADYADKLHGKLRARGVPNGHGLRDEDATFECERSGAQCELAVSLILEVPWTAYINQNDPYMPDVGQRTQVRGSNKQRPSHSLIIRSRDLWKYHNVPFVLVIQDGNFFTVKGWTLAYRAIEIGKLWNGGDSGRPDAFFTHESKLWAIDTLRNP